MATVQRTTADALAQASGWGALAIYGNGMRWPGNPYFSFHDCSVFNAAYSLIPPGAIPPAVPPPDVNWTLWNGTDDVATFLNTQDAAGGWVMCTGNPTTNGYAQRVANPAEANTGWWLCEVPGWLLPYISGQALSAGLPLYQIPPIWPGAARATLGEMVSLGQTWTIEGPLNGLLISIASVPVGSGRYDWGAYTQYPRAGYVSFLNDGGTFEDAQPFTFEAHIVCPKLCRSAVRAVGRCKSGVSGFAQAWTFMLP